MTNNTINNIDEQLLGIRNDNSLLLSKILAKRSEAILLLVIQALLTLAIIVLSYLMRDELLFSEHAPTISRSVYIVSAMASLILGVFVVITTDVLTKTRIPIEHLNTTIVGKVESTNVFKKTSLRLSMDLNKLLVNYLITIQSLQEPLQHGLVTLAIGLICCSLATIIFL